jgi:hypothetical protein
MTFTTEPSPVTPHPIQPQHSKPAIPKQHNLSLIVVAEK